MILEAAPPVVADAARRAGRERAHAVGAQRARAAPAGGTLRRLALASPSAMPLADVAFTANTGRAAHEHRLAVIAGDSAEAGEALAQIADGRRVDDWRGVRAGARPVSRFCSPGRARSTPGMGRELYEQSRCSGRRWTAVPPRWRRPEEPLLDVLSAGRASDAARRDALDAAGAVRARVRAGRAVAIVGSRAGRGARPQRRRVRGRVRGRRAAGRGRRPTRGGARPLIGALPPGGVMTAAWEGEARVREIIAPWPAVESPRSTGRPPWY